MDFETEFLNRRKEGRGYKSDMERKDKKKNKETRKDYI
jgi:hypothetical protein